MSRYIFVFLLSISLAFLSYNSYKADHFLAVPYCIWIILVGFPLWRYREKIEERLLFWDINVFVKFITLLLCMVLGLGIVEGVFAYLTYSTSTQYLLKGAAQFVAYGVCTYAGLGLGWYLLLRKIQYSKLEVVLLVGLFGLFADGVGAKILSNPFSGIALILPTMCLYAITLAPSIMSFPKKEKLKQIPIFIRHLSGFIVPIIISLPFLALLAALRLFFPDYFPPVGLVG